MRGRKLETNERINLFIQPFDNPYLLRVKVIGREIHRDRKIIRLSVGMRKIDRKTLELRPYRKLKRDATLPSPRPPRWFYRLRQNAWSQP